jgi:hypothetical protein
VGQFVGRARVTLGSCAPSAVPAINSRVSIRDGEFRLSATGSGRERTYLAVPTRMVDAEPGESPQWLIATVDGTMIRLALTAGTSRGKLLRAMEG